MLKNNSSFTLIELVIVIGILAILAVVVIIVLNPSEFLRQARDSTRMSDLQTINKSLGLYQSDGGTSLGSSNTVYVSIPSSQSNCSDLGLPVLPSNWFYACSNSTNYRKVDSNGWIPVNLTSISFGSSLDTLPIDPVNSTSTGNYYTYVVGGSWKLATLFESQKYTERAAKDGGPDLAEYEIGTNLDLAPFTHGLVGYWKLDESSGNLADSSGWGNNGTQSGGVTYGASGKVGNALSFDGSDDYVDCGNGTSLDFSTGNFTIEAWIKTTTETDGAFFSKKTETYSAVGNGITILKDSAVGLRIGMGGGSTNSTAWLDRTSYATNQWIHVVAVFDRINNIAYRFRNGIRGDNVDISSITGSLNTGETAKIGTSNDSWGPFDGLVDEVRIYNRALSAAEIAAIYNTTK